MNKTKFLQELKQGVKHKSKDELIEATVKIAGYLSRDVYDDVLSDLKKSALSIMI